MDDRLPLNSLLTSKKTIISFIISFLILYLLIRNINMTELIAISKNMSIPLYIGAFLIHYSSFIVRGMRWKKLLDSLEIKTDSITSTEIVFLSWFANSIVPAKIGDVYRSYLLKKENSEPISRSIGTIVVERMLDVALLLFLLTLSGYLLYEEQIPKDIDQTLKLGYALIILLIFGVMFLKIFEKKLMHPIPESFRIHIANLSHGIFNSFSDIETIIYVLFMSLAIWVLESGRMFLVTESLGIDIGIYTIVFVALASTLLTAIPLTPAGLGAVEFSIVFLLALNGVDTNTGTAVAFLDRLISYWSLLIIGTIVYIISKKT